MLDSTMCALCTISSNSRSRGNLSCRFEGQPSVDGVQKQYGSNPQFPYLDCKYYTCSVGLKEAATKIEKFHIGLISPEHLYINGELVLALSFTSYHKKALRWVTIERPYRIIAVDDTDHIIYTDYYDSMIDRILEAEP